MGLDLFERDNSLSNIMEIQYQPYETISTGKKIIDKVLSGQGGLPTTCVLLLGGAPGTGKTSLLMQVMASMEGKVIYNSSEESKPQLRGTFERVTKGMTPNRECVLGNIDNANILCEEISKSKPKLLILDSIQGLHDPDCTCRGETAQTSSATKKVIKLAKGLQIPVIIICQLGKDGNFRGGNDIKHNVDACAYLRRPKVEDGTRIFQMEKNRFGPIGETSLLWEGGRYDLDRTVEQKIYEAGESKEIEIIPMVSFKGTETPRNREDILLEAYRDYSKYNMGQPQTKLLVNIILRKARGYPGLVITENDHKLFSITLSSMRRLIGVLSKSLGAKEVVLEPIAKIRF
jgi:hypothetical protein